MNTFPSKAASRCCAILFTIGAGCGPSAEIPSTGEPICRTASCERFRALEGLDPGGFARPIGEMFRVTGHRLAAFADGGSWLLWRSHADPDDHAGTLRVDRFAPDGTFVETSTLSPFEPTDIVLLRSGRLIGWRNLCGERRTDVCFATTSPTGERVETSWAAVPRSVTSYALDDNGDIVGTVVEDRMLRVLGRASAASNGLYAVVNEGAYFIARLDDDASHEWSRPVLPRVTVPGIGPDSPLEELIRASDLARQTLTAPVAVSGGVVVAAAVSKGTLAAINTHYGVDLPLPADPACADILVVRMHDTGERDYWVVPTAVCEALPELAVVGDTAVVASVVSVSKAPAPNDTSEYDVGISFVDMTTSSTRSVVFGGSDDEWVESIAPCGEAKVCIGGVAGSRSVDTGSVVTFGDGFILPVSVDGEIGAPWTLTSSRHSTVWDLSPVDDGRVLFIATTNGPITHTGDADPSLDFDEGRLGYVAVPRP